MVDVIGKAGFAGMNSSLMRPAVVSLICISVLSSCTTSNTRNAGGGLLGRSGASATPYISALQGGIAGRSGLQMSRGDFNRAMEAEYQALETSPGGQAVIWGSGDTRGEVVANAPYQVGNQNCRQYAHSLTVDGKQAKVRGAACRNTDGTWTPLT